MKGYRQNDVRLLLRILFRRVQENGQLLVFAEIGEVRFAFDFKMGTLSLIHISEPTRH